MLEFINMALRICPKDCRKTLLWFTQMPIED
jgi:hypothetical protein